MIRSASDNSRLRLPGLKTAHLRLVVFLLGTLVSCTLGLYFFPTPVRGYVAQALLGLSTAPEESATTKPLTKGEAADAKELLLSDVTLRQALKQAGPPPNVKRPSLGDFPADSEIAFVRDRLTVEHLENKKPDTSLLSLSYSGTDAKWSVSLVEKLARQTLAAFEEQAKTAGTETTKVYSQKVALAERHEQAARRALDDFLSRHFDALSRTATNPPAHHPGNAAQPNDAALPVPKLNPKWQGLQERLTTEHAKREQILLDRTPDHPEAQEAAVRIDALQQQLEKTPKFIVDETNPLAGRTPRRKWNGNVRPAQFTQGEAGSGESLKLNVDASIPDEYESLLAALHDARDARLAAERNTESSQARVSVVRGKIVATARLAQTLRESPSTGRLTVLALASIFAGACLAAMIRNPRNSPLLATIAQVEADLSLPVVGVVPPPTTSAVALSR